MSLLPAVNKPCEFIGSLKRDLSAMPDDVKEVIGFAIFAAQTGNKHESAKPLKGFGGAGVLEVVENCDGDGNRNGDAQRHNTISISSSKG
jgi:phage-related protein